MQIGLRLHDSAEAPFEKRLKMVKSQGFSCIHFALKKTTGLPYSIEALTPGYAFYLKRCLREAELDAAVLGCYLNLGNPDPDELRGIQKMYTAHLRLASIIGCGMVGTETGAPNREYRCDESCRTGKALDTFIKNLRPVVKDAERFGVTIAIEPVYKHIVCSPERARIVLDEIDSPNLRIIFDPVNLLAPDQIDKRDETIKDAIDKLGEEIAMIHLKDYRVTDDKMTCMACGLGDMDYSQVLRFAKEKKPYIQATLENTTPANAVAALNHIRAVYDKV